jgi:hypothetical protein
VLLNSVDERQDEILVAELARVWSSPICPKSGDFGYLSVLIDRSRPGGDVAIKAAL